MPLRGHIDRHFEQDLLTLRNSILHMGGQIEKNISDAMSCLKKEDLKLAREVIRRDHVVNCFEIDIDELCLRLLALRQPAASDLRVITTALKIVTDLERIGDLATNVAERCVAIGSMPRPAVVERILEMSGLAQKMVKESLDAFVRRDTEMAEQVIAADRQLDELHRTSFQAVVQLMQAVPADIPEVVNILSIARYLERIGDHATNIAEMVVFMVRGKDIRHLWSRQGAQTLAEGKLDPP